MIEKIVFEKILYAIIIRKNYTYDGIKFFTEDSSPQQIGYMKRPKNYRISPHIHFKNQESLMKHMKFYLLNLAK